MRNVYSSRRLRFAAATLVSVTLVSCNRGESPTSTTTAAGTAATASTTGAPTTPTPTTLPVTPPDDDGGIDPMVGADTSPKTGPAATSDTALLTAVRAARHEGYDRVVFEFRNGVPGWDVRYTDKPILADASGKEVPVAGQYALKVRMQPASGVDLSGVGAPRTYTGPTRFTSGTPEIAEVVQTGDFEAVLSWAVGVNDRVDFRAFTLPAPPRLVIDVGNH
jgi:hypothetical protein